jgi:hypothetical protein
LEDQQIPQEFQEGAPEDDSYLTIKNGGYNQ